MVAKITYVGITLNISFIPQKMQKCCTIFRQYLSKFAWHLQHLPFFLRARLSMSIKKEYLVRGSPTQLRTEQARAIDKHMSQYGNVFFIHNMHVSEKTT